MNIYSKILENNKIKGILSNEQIQLIKYFETEEYKNNVTFKDLFVRLSTELKEKIQIILKLMT